jgi:L-ascorbate metabolism protein UlaG (beta-lactamase superfamily)
MTQDEIIEMARQAKAIPMHKDFNQLALIGTENLEAFAKLVAKKEREACATMSDWILKEGGGTWGDAIRKRK